MEGEGSARRELEDENAGDVRIEDHEEIGRVGRETFRAHEEVRRDLHIRQVNLGHPTEADGAGLERWLDDVEVGDDLRDRVHLSTDESVEVVDDPLRAAEGELDFDLGGEFGIDGGGTLDFDLGCQVAGCTLRGCGLNHGLVLSISKACRITGQDLYGF